MRKAIGIGCIILGVVCLIVSVGFVLFNHLEDKKAQETAQVVLHSAQHAIQEQDIPSQPPIEETDQSVPKAETEERNPEMSTISVDGYDCIGILSIPVLELELPIFTGWSSTVKISLIRMLITCAKKWAWCSRNPIPFP